MCRDMGLTVDEMSEELSEVTQNMIVSLLRLAHDNVICQPTKSGNRMPHFQYFPYAKPSGDNGVKTEEDSKNANPSTKTSAG